ncbi:MAG: hypothetical protein ACR2IK_05700 [Chloroflexota bacterium]
MEPMQIKICSMIGRPRPLSPQRQQAAWLRDRTARAAVIVLTRSIEQQRDGSWLVQSQHDNSRFYRVSARGCSCADAFTKAPDGLCKHALAARIVARVKGGAAT